MFLRRPGDGCRYSIKSFQLKVEKNVIKTALFSITALIVSLTLGCGTESVSDDDQQTPRNSARQHDVDREVLLAQGTVFDEHGERCGNAKVALGLDAGVTSNAVYGVADDRGDFQIFGSHRPDGCVPIWAIDRLGRMGVQWNSSGLQKSNIEVRGQKTKIVVCNRACERIAKARVEVVLTCIDDLDVEIPDAFRDLLTATTNDDGIVEFLTAIGADAGFVVNAIGFESRRIEFYEPASLRVIVVDGDRKDRIRCQTAVARSRLANAE